MIRYTNTCDEVDWQAAAEVFRLAPLGERESAQLERAFRHSYACVLVYDDERLIGLARALCDGEYQAAIYDVVLLPAYHGQGIGRDMVQRLCRALPVANIILYAVAGREGFYRTLGFKRMRTAMAILHPRLETQGYLED